VSTNPATEIPTERADLKQPGRVEECFGVVGLKRGVPRLCDPPRMFQTIQSTRKPCGAYKVPAAGRRVSNLGVTHDFIHRHCPEEKRMMERTNTMRNERLAYS
jgi:hypothetical protein